MNKYLLRILTLVLITFVFGRSYLAKATVGGEIYIRDIAYDALYDTVYYQVDDNGGRGCPNIIHTLNPVTGEDNELMTCDEFYFKFVSTESMSRSQSYDDFITDTYRNLTYIPKVSLDDVNINVRPYFVSTNVVANEVMSVNMRADILQDGEKIETVEFTGCEISQPQTFEGYLIPNTNNMLLKISTIGDCFEGGYLTETIHLIKNTKLNDLPKINMEKANTDADSYPSTLPEKSSSASNIPTLYVIGSVIFGILVLTGGFLAGFLIGKKVTHTKNNPS